MTSIDDVLIKSTFSKIVKVKDIKLGNRFRQELGDYSGLAESIREVGLLHPIVITEDNKLVAGARRLEACKGYLKWDEIPATVINIKDIVKAELDENNLRKDFTFSERQVIREVTKPVLEKEAEARKKATQFGASDSVEPIATGRTDEKLANYFGFSRDTERKEEKIAEVIKDNPKIYEDLVERIDSGEESIDHAYRSVVDEEADNARAADKARKAEEEYLKEMPNIAAHEVIQSIVDELKKELEK